MSTQSDFEQVDHIMSQRHLRRSRRNWRYIAFAAIAIAIVAILGKALGGFSEPVSEEHIARVVVDGTIASDPERRYVLNELANDEKVKAVIVQINSPGGTTAGGEELYEGLAALRAQKPVAAVINEVGASAAYMTAISSDRVFARRLSIVGSIGVLYMHLDASKLFETIGIDYDKVATGPLKAEPDLDEAMTPMVRQSLQELVDDSYDWFVDIVAERRELARTDVLKIADGRILTGRQALDLKLIDAIGGEPEVLDWLQESHEIADLDVRTYYPLPESDFDRLRDILGSSLQEMLSDGLNRVTALDGLVSVWQPSQ